MIAAPAPPTRATPSAARLDRLRQRIAAAGADALLVSQPESRFYLSGYTGHDLPPRDSAGYLLVADRRALLLTDPRTQEQARAEAPDFEVVEYAAGARGPERVVEMARSLGIRRLAFESIHLPHAIWNQVAKGLNGSDVEVVETDALVDSLRVVKDAAELADLQAAIDVLDACLASVLQSARPGLTERQVAHLISAYLLEHADGTAFPSIVASGPNGSMPHAVPTERVIREGEAITIDIGALLHGYCSDLTRTVCFGPPRDARVEEIRDIVLEAQQTAIRAIRPGMTGKEADAIARGVVTGAGYGERFTHSLGHGIGLEVHEPPWVSHVRGDAVLEAGMVFSVEPGIYIPGWGGVRIEDLVVLEDDGPRVLSRAPRDLVISSAR